MSPLKEPGFFRFEGEQIDFCGPGDKKYYRGRPTSIEAYKKLFQGVSDQVAVGEASTWYLPSTKVPQRIYSYIPHVKLIAILRNPIDRAYSAYVHARREAREPLDSFVKALHQENNRIQSNWGYLWRYRQMGLYGDQLERYYQQFDRSQIRVYLYEDLNYRPLELLRDLFLFLKIDESFTPDLTIRRNVSGMPKSRALHVFLSQKNPVKNLLKPLLPTQFRERLVSKLTIRNLKKKEPLPIETRQEVAEIFKADIIKLQNILQRDLSHWLDMSPSQYNQSTILGDEKAS